MPEKEEPATKADPCVTELILAVTEVHPEADVGYVASLVDRVCFWSKCRGQDPYDIVAIISTETRFVEQTKCGRFGCGAMQVIGAHARRRGLPREALLDLNTNVEIGTEVWDMSHRNLGNYNGHATPGYTADVHHWYAKLQDATSN
jgi:hypothetical protein